MRVQRSGLDQRTIRARAFPLSAPSHVTFTASTASASSRCPLAISTPRCRPAAQTCVPPLPVLAPAPCLPQNPVDKARNKAQETGENVRNRSQEAGENVQEGAQVRSGREGWKLKHASIHSLRMKASSASVLVLLLSRCLGMAAVSCCAWSWLPPVWRFCAADE